MGWIRISAQALGVALILTIPPAYGGKEEAEQAVMEVMFGIDELRSEQFMYSVQAIGWVDLSLDDGVPDQLVKKIVKALKSHPEISGVSLVRANICTN